MSGVSGMLNGVARDAESRGAVLIGAIMGWELRIGPGTNPVTRTDARRVLAPWGKGDSVPETYAAADGIARASYEIPLAAVGASKQNMSRSFASAKDADTTAALLIYEKIPVAGERGETWKATARVRVDVASGTALALPPDGLPSAPKGLAYAAKVADWANYLIAHVATRDISNAMCAIVREQLRVVPVFGRKAGVYFVPAAHVADAERLAADLAHLGADVNVVRQTDISAAPLATKSATQSFGARIKALSAKVEQIRTSGMRSDGIASGLAEATALRDEVALWSGVAGFQAAAIADVGAKLAEFFATAASTGRRGLTGLAAPDLDVGATGYVEPSASDDDELSPFEI